jgi:hypothetical protein
MSTTARAALGTYLTDHLGGARAGVEMARRLQSEVQGEQDAEILGRLAEEIEEDRQVLQGLVERFSSTRRPAKQAAGWVAEKVQRLGIAEPVTGTAHLTRLLQTELLALGVEGKLCLWLSLSELAPTYTELAELDLARLEERARDQRRRLEQVRLSVARRTFVSAG